MPGHRSSRSGVHGGGSGSATAHVELLAGWLAWWLGTDGTVYRSQNYQGATRLDPALRSSWPTSRGHAALSHVRTGHAFYRRPGNVTFCYDVARKPGTSGRPASTARRRGDVTSAVTSNSSTVGDRVNGNIYHRRRCHDGERPRSCAAALPPLWLRRGVVLLAVEIEMEVGNLPVSNGPVTLE
jgi:hypothetical protein